MLSDPHGNFRRFRSVRDKIPLGAEDHLVVSGDAIDRHKDGIDLLREIAGAENITMLLGNHEYMMLNALTPEGEKLPWKRDDPERERLIWFLNGGKPTYDAYMRLSQVEQKELREFLVSLPINLDISVNGVSFKLVHAAPVELYQGRYGHSDKYRDATAFAVWHRFDDFTYIPEDYIMVFGHTPTLYYQSDRTLSVFWGDGVIGIDCGSGFDDLPSESNPFQGRLCCLRLNDMQVFYSDEQSDLS